MDLALNQIESNIFICYQITKPAGDSFHKDKRISVMLSTGRTYCFIVFALTIGTVLIEREKSARDAALRDKAAALLREREQRERAEHDAALARRSLYAVNMRDAIDSWKVGNSRRALELLEAHRPKPGQPDLRGFEWHYMWAQLCGARFAVL